MHELEGGYMEKINILFIQDRKIKKKRNTVTLGDMINKQIPDTYEIDYISVKENMIGKIEQFQPQIIYIFQSNAFDILELVKRIKEEFPEVVILTNLSDGVKSPQKMMAELKDAGVYKCYHSTLILETLIHDMFVALNME